MQDGPSGLLAQGTPHCDAQPRHLTAKFLALVLVIAHCLQGDIADVKVDLWLALCIGPVIIE